MSENVKNNIVVHPADALAVALDRASRLLAVLTELYDANRDGFVGGNAFVVHGFSTASELIEEAGRALADLHDKCDLTLLAETIQTVETVAAKTVLPDRAAPAKAAAAVPVLHHHATVAAVSTLEEASKPPATESRNYRDFLDRITKAEAFAAPSPPAGSPAVTPELLPMLKALRKEVEKYSGTG